MLEISLIDNCHFPSHYQWHSIRFDSWSGIVRGFIKWSSTLWNCQVNCWVLWWWHRFKRVIIFGFSHYSGEHFIERTYQVIQECYHPSKAKWLSLSQILSLSCSHYITTSLKSMLIPFNQQKHTFAKLKYFTALQQLK